MGIEVQYRRLSKAEFERICRDPKQRKDFTAPNIPGLDLDELMNLVGDPQALQATLQAKGPEIAAAFQRGREDPTRANLDKDWHALHFLLTGDSSMDTEHRPNDPLHNVVMGGQKTKISTGYGPARMLTVKDVRAIAEALGRISVDNLRGRFSAEEFNAADIYPNPQPGGWSEDEIEGVFHLYPQLVTFFKEAAKAGEIVVVYAT